MERRLIRILIAEDMRMLRRALVELISLEPDIEVVAELETGTEIVPRVEELKPDVAVLDIELPGVDGIAAAEALHRRGAGAKVLILTSLGFYRQSAPGPGRTGARLPPQGRGARASSPTRSAPSPRASASSTLS